MQKRRVDSGRCVHGALRSEGVGKWSTCYVRLTLVSIPLIFYQKAHYVAYTLHVAGIRRYLVHQLFIFMEQIAISIYMLCVVIGIQRTDCIIHVQRPDRLGLVAIFSHTNASFLFLLLVKHSVCMDVPSVCIYYISYILNSIFCIIYIYRCINILIVDSWNTLFMFKDETDMAMSPYFLTIIHLSYLLLWSHDVCDK